MRVTLNNVQAGKTITARLADGDETLLTVVSVLPVFDSDDLPLAAYEAVFTPPASLPVQLDWIEDEGEISEEVIWSQIISPQPSASSGDPVDPAGIADYAKMHLGGENWDVLTTASNFGPSYVALAIDAVKRRVMSAPVLPAAEPALDPRLLDYLGILSALSLLSATRTAWASKTITRTAGNDPQEITQYTDRAKLIDELRDDLMLKLPAIQGAALPVIDQPLIGVGARPAIDELDDCKVTDDPRRFPPASTFPYDRDDILALRQRWY